MAWNSTHRTLFLLSKSTQIWRCWSMPSSQIPRIRVHGTTTSGSCNRSLQSRSCRFNTSRRKLQCWLGYHTKSGTLKSSISKWLEMSMDKDKAVRTRSNSMWKKWPSADWTRASLRLGNCRYLASPVQSECNQRDSPWASSRVRKSVRIKTGSGSISSHWKEWGFSDLYR